MRVDARSARARASSAACFGITRQRLPLLTGSKPSLANWASRTTLGSSHPFKHSPNVEDLLHIDVMVPRFVECPGLGTHGHREAAVPSSTMLPTLSSRDKTSCHSML